MEDTQTRLHLEASSHVVSNSVLLYLLLEFQGQLLWQINQARHEVNRVQALLSRPQTKRLNRLSRYKPVGEVEPDVQVLEPQIELSVRIGEVGKEDDVPVEVLGRVEVHAVEVHSGYLKRRVTRLYRDEDDQGRYPEEDEDEAEYEAEYGPAPHQQVSPPRSVVVKQ